MFFRYSVRLDGAGAEFTNSKRRAIAKARELAAYHDRVAILDRETNKWIEF